MRQRYTVVSPQFYTGDTGVVLREDPEAQRLALYLMITEHANMVGLYRIAMPTIAHEVGGMTPEGASMALQRLSKLEFAYWDERTEYLWVRNMAFYQIGLTMAPRDKRRVMVEQFAQQARKTPFCLPFWELYREPFNLPEWEWLKDLPKVHPMPHESPFDARQQSPDTSQQIGPSDRAATKPAAAPTTIVVEDLTDKNEPRRVVKHFAARFHALTGRTMTIAFARDIARVKPAVSAHGVEATLALVDRFFDSQDGWWVEKRQWGIGEFMAAINTLAGQDAPASAAQRLSPRMRRNVANAQEVLRRAGEEEAGG